MPLIRKGALDAPILFQSTNRARRGSRKRPDPPLSRTTGRDLSPAPFSRVALMTKTTKQLSKANRPAQHGPYRCDRLQMPNTINGTNPMPTNSTTSATESYSSQCRLRESIGAAHPSERTAAAASSIAYSTTPSIAVFWTTVSVRVKTRGPCPDTIPGRETCNQKGVETRDHSL